MVCLEGNQETSCFDFAMIAFLYRFSFLACAPLLFVDYSTQPVGGAAYVERDSSLEVMEEITFSGNTLGFRTDSSWVRESLFSFFYVHSCIG